MGEIFDFKLIINGTTFEIKETLFGVVSTRFYKLQLNDDFLECTFPDNVFHCFCVFVDIFKGISF
jgi:hypothetical protein